jgi:hypothetical protein
MTVAAHPISEMNMASRNCNIDLRSGPSGRRALAAAVSIAFALLGSAPIASSSAFAQAAAPQQKVGRAKPAVQTKQRQSAAAPQAEPRRTQQSKGFLDTIMEGPRLTTTPPEAADWVRASRPAPDAPRPAARPPGPGRPLLTADEIRAREAQLDRLRARHDRIAGRKAPTGKFGSAAGKPQAEEKEKYKPGCALTCSNPIVVPRTRRR